MITTLIAPGATQARSQQPQTFGGCDCAVPIAPKPPAQLQDERQALVDGLNRMHNARGTIMEEFAECVRKQLVLIAARKPVAERLAAARKLLAAIQSDLDRARARDHLAAIADLVRSEKNCLDTIATIEAELMAIESSFTQLETEKNDKYAEAERLRSEWIHSLSVVNRDEFVQDRLALLDQEIAQDPGFADGYLYRSLLQMQAGDQKKAASDIRDARQRMYGTTMTLKQKFKSDFKPAQIVDMVYASLLLGQEQPAWNYVEICRQRFPEFVNHPVYLHMKAKYEEYENSYSTASDLYHEAIKRVEGTDARPPEEAYNVEELYADAAWFYAAVPAPSSRDPSEAIRCAELALQKTNCSSWLAWRAIAAVKASEENWPTALAAMEHCRHHAPLHLDAELAEQVQKYHAREPYWMKRHPAD